MFVCVGWECVWVGKGEGHEIHGFGILLYLRDRVYLLPLSGLWMMDQSAAVFPSSTS